jgi:pSer/pThr/pTyr-binding forkhead associated (FHA) protein
LKGRHLTVSGIIDGVASIDIEVLARTAYDAYRRAQKGPVPRWDEISATEQQGWRAAVSAVSSRGEDTLTDAGPTPSLVVKVGGQTQVFSTDFTAGRQGNLAVSDDHASNHHARFQFAHGVWYIEDLNSTNGTWLNGRRIFGAQRLTRNDKIRIGRTAIVVVSAGA